MKKETMTNNKKAGTGNGSGNEMKKKKYSEAPQASFVASNWQRWVRQLGFSNGSHWHRSSPFFFPCLAVLRLHRSVCVCVPSLTPGQAVFGSSVVSCPECYQESSSDGQPTSPLSAASPCRVRRKEKKIRTGGSVIKNRSRQTSEVEVQISLFTDK